MLVWRRKLAKLFDLRPVGWATLLDLSPIHINCVCPTNRNVILGPGSYPYLLGVFISLSVNEPLVFDVMLRTRGHLYLSSCSLVACCLGTGSRLHYTVTYFLCYFVRLFGCSGSISDYKEWACWVTAE